MPEIHPSAVVSFSSEDKEYPASNLLTPSSFKKWLCAKAGEKSAAVEFQLPKAERISQIDIGNAGSAFIEVLVRRSSDDGDYQCLLVSSSFMSPLDARARTNLNRVRIFKADKLSKLVHEQRWDRVKVVCSQPFVKTEQYGLSFIRCYTEEGGEEGKVKEKAKQGTLAGFVIRDRGSDDEEEEGTSSGLFKKAMEAKKEERKRESEDEESATTPSNAATQIRAASKAAESEINKAKESKEVRRAAAASSPASTPPSRKRSSSSEEAAGDSRPTPKRQRKDEAKEERRPKKKDTRPRGSRSDSDDDGGSSLVSVMRGVEFVLSGYQNPLRGRLRDVAAEMGAQYRANWGPGCTHLICAFESTPKYREVSGKGRIVTDKWILDCHKRKKLLPWRTYRLGRAPSPSDSEGGGRGRRRRPPPTAMAESGSDDDDDDSDEAAPARKRRAPPARRKPADDDDDDWRGSSDDADSDAEMRRRKRARMRKRDGADDEEEWRPSKKDRQEESDSEPDADIDEESSGPEEEEEEEVMPKKKDRSKAPPARKASPRKGRAEISDVSDDEEKPKAAPPGKKQAPLTVDSGSDSDGGWAPIRRKKESSASPGKTAASPARSPDAARLDLPTFFHDAFFMYGALEAGLRRALQRIIVAYGGRLQPYMSDSVKFVVTAAEWDDNFDDALMTNSSLIFVRPQWLLECDQKRKLVPYQKFQVVG